MTYATRPWSYPMEPPPPIVIRLPQFEDKPENIARCCNCPYPDCKFNTISDCIKSDSTKRQNRKPRKVKEEWKYGYWRTT